MTGEHLWPVWMHPYLPKIPNAKNWTAIVLETIKGAETTRKKPRMGHVFTKTINVVCKKCNESWMNDIEGNAKPILIPIIQGEHTFIDHDSQIKLATWLALKFLVADHDKDAFPISSKETLMAFKGRQEIPQKMKIWIAHHNAFEWSAGCWNRGLTMSFGPKPPVSKLRKNIQTIAFGAGHVFSLTCFSLLDRIDLTINNPFVAKLWPTDFYDIEWPLPITPLTGINALANVIDDLESSLDFKWGTLDGS